jgi:hypothetical protein
MTSIWFFVALAVACVATYLLRHRYVAEAIHAPDCQPIIDGHEGKAHGHKCGNGCCH